MRAEQALLTRNRVVDAAAELFLERGFSRTTIAAIAQTSGVSSETIYATFDGKRGVLEAVIDTTIAGPTSIPLEEQSAWEAIARNATARARLRAYIAFACSVLDRTSPIHDIIRGAADSEPFALELSARLLRERLESNVKHLRDYIGRDLRRGVALRRAAERFCALTSPETHHLLTVKLGWTLRAYREWITKVLEDDLLGAE
jgi:AcrR family transcriptional regulator